MRPYAPENTQSVVLFRIVRVLRVGASSYFCFEIQHTTMDNNNILFFFPSSFSLLTLTTCQLLPISLNVLV